MAEGEGEEPQPKRGTCALSVVCFCEIRPNEFGLHFRKQSPCEGLGYAIEAGYWSLCDSYLSFLGAIGSLLKQKTRKQLVAAKQKWTAENLDNLTAAVVYRF